MRGIYMKHVGERTGEKSKTDEVEDEMRRQKSNRNTTQVMHKIWNDIDEGVHTCDAYVYFEDARLSPLGAQHDLIYRVQAFVIPSEHSAVLWRERLPGW